MNLPEKRAAPWNVWADHDPTILHGISFHPFLFTETHTRTGRLAPVLYEPFFLSIATFENVSLKAVVAPLSPFFLSLSRLSFTPCIKGAVSSGCVRVSVCVHASVCVLRRSRHGTAVSWIMDGVLHTLSSTTPRKKTGGKTACKQTNIRIGFGKWANLKKCGLKMNGFNVRQRWKQEKCAFLLGFQLRIFSPRF